MPVGGCDYLLRYDAAAGDRGSRTQRTKTRWRRQGCSPRQERRPLEDHHQHLEDNATPLAEIQKSRGAVTLIEKKCERHIPAEYEYEYELNMNVYVYV